jgi:hypothetical protein
MHAKNTSQTAQSTSCESLITHELLKSTSFFKSLQSKNLHVLNKITSTNYGTVEVGIFYSTSMLASDAEKQLNEWMKQSGKKIACIQSTSQLSQFLSNNNFGISKQLEQYMIAKAMVFNFFHFGNEEISSVMQEMKSNKFNCIT